jgi:hypothetical protein
LLVEALELLMVVGVDHLPVIDGGRLVGICTRADIIGARADQLAMEHRQHGWLRPVLNRRRPPRLLVVGNRTLGDPAILETISQRAGPGRIEVHVVAPTGSSSDDGAEERLAHQLAALRAAGWSATGEIVSSRPVTAVRETVRTRPVDEIILATLPPGLSGWLRIDAVARIERLTHIPVTHVVVERS